MRFRDCIEDNFFTQYVNRPTRNGNILDLVLSNEPDLVGALEVMDCLARSDHNMISWTVYFGGAQGGGDRETLDFRRADFESMREELRMVCWDELLVGDIHEAWVKFRDLLKSLERKYIPVRKVARRKPLWITNKAIELVRRKRRAHARYKDSKHPACVVANRRASAEVRRAKMNFEKKLAQNIKYDSKSFFAYVRSKSKAKVRVGSLRGQDGELMESGEEVAEEFSRYFGSVFSREDLDCIPGVERRYDLRTGGLNHIIITYDMVRRELRKLRADKSPGVDELSPRLLLHVQEEICYPLWRLFLLTLREGGVPDDWKRANVVSIFKAGSRSKAENYRPVSLTSQICKMFEALVRDALVGYLEANGLIRASQHGFRKGRSCLTNLLRFLDEVTDGLDGGGSVDVIFLDFAKAFDKVPHERLLRKMEAYGIGGEVLAWVREWLRDRKQRVGLGGCWSEWCRVLSGVPQGSVLGPILFLIFIDDLDDGLSSTILKFADDTKIYGGVDSWEDRNRLQRDLERLVEWADRWQMSFNVEKCKVMHLGGHNMEGVELCDEAAKVESGEGGARFGGDTEG